MLSAACCTLLSIRWPGHSGISAELAAEIADRRIDAEIGPAGAGTFLFDITLACRGAAMQTDAKSAGFVVLVVSGLQGLRLRDSAG